MRNNKQKSNFTQNIKMKDSKSHNYALANVTAQSMNLSKSQFEEAFADQAFASLKQSNPAHTRTTVQINQNTGSTLQSMENPKYSNQSYGGNIQVLADNKDSKKRKKQLNNQAYLNNSKH